MLPLPLPPLAPVPSTAFAPLHLFVGSVRAEKAKAGYSKEGIPYDTEIFMACPQDCQFPLQFELVGDAKVWASGGRLIKDVVACAIFDISKLEVSCMLPRKVHCS